MLLNYTAPRRYLVTGGAGFIGSHLVEALIARKHEVVVLDNLSTGKRENVHPHATLIVGDTTHYDTVRKALRTVHGCFHLAAVASVEKSVQEWARTHSVNVTSTVNIFQAISQLDYKIPVVYTSSAAIYGNCEQIPISEDAPTKPLTAYGADKLGCDLHGAVAQLVHRIPNTGLRPFNVYGPRQDPSSPYSGVISIFADRMQKRQPVTIYGDGGQVRDFVYVTDAVSVFLAAMDRLESIGTPEHDVINMCTGRASSINDLADALEAIANRPLERHYALPRRGDIRLSVGNPARLRERLGLSLDVTLRQGLGMLLTPARTARAG